jgi:hypothetical protein
MIFLAEEYNIKVVKVLELLKLMLDASVIDMPRIRAIVSFWICFDDMPKNCKKDFKSIFSENLPDPYNSET